ncbi:hypothetical protein D3C81_1540210 [compost metagenome]
MDGVGHIEGRQIQADRLEYPAWRSVAAAHPAPDVLMEVDEDRQAVIVRLGADGGQVVEIVLIILARPGVLDCLPGG